jgi:hypothetical protein
MFWDVGLSDDDEYAESCDGDIFSGATSATGRAICDD